jgi:hypothetical protein
MKMPEHTIPEQPNALRPEEILKGAQQTPNNGQLHFDTTDPGYTMDPARQGLHRGSKQKESGFEGMADWAGKLAGRFSEREMMIAGGLLLLGACVSEVDLTTKKLKKKKKDTTWRNPALHRAEGAYWNEHPTNEYP